MQGLADSSVYGGALQSPYSLTISSCSLFIPRLFGLFAACLGLLWLVYLTLNAFDKCHLGGHPSSRKFQCTQNKGKPASWFLIDQTSQCPQPYFPRRSTLLTLAQASCTRNGLWLQCAGEWGNGHQVTPQLYLTKFQHLFSSLSIPLVV